MNRFKSLGVSKYRGSSPILGAVFIGTSGLCALMALYNFFASNAAQEQINFRKKQLSQPVYVLSE